MLRRSMAVSNTAGRWLGLFVFLACVAFSAFGVWYLNGGRFGQEDDEAAENDEEEPTPEGTGVRRGSKKKATKQKKRASEGRQARGNAVQPAERPSSAGPTGPSYESAIAGNNLNLAPGVKDVPDLTDAELAGPMRDGTFLDACGVPASAHVTVKVAIRGGRAVGISVYPSPPSSPIAGCIERYVKGLQWPSNAKMDSFVTTY